MPQSKILVLSLSRMGDIIQSIPFFRRLRLRSPEAEIHVLVENCFADVAALLPGVDQVHSVRLEDLLLNFNEDRRGGLPTAMSFFRNWMRDLQAERFTEVWNLTHTRPSVLLNFLLAGESGQGVTLDQNGLQRVNDPWLTYFFATNLARPWCQFNLVDIYANCVKDVEWGEGRTLAITPPYCDWLPDNPRRVRIALHPGASQKAKQWPLETFREVALQLSRYPHVDLVLVGGPADRDHALAFDGIPNVTNVMGRTTVPELAGVLRQCDLVISNDSGPMHVAAAVGTRVIAVTLGSALGSETAPYGVGHVVIEPARDCFPCSPQHTCPRLTCAADIPVVAVVSLTEWLTGLQSSEPDLTDSNCRVYRTAFSSHDGLLELQPFDGITSSARDLLHSLVRPAWLKVLSNIEARHASIPADEIDVALADDAAEALLCAWEAQGLAQELRRSSGSASLSVRRIQKTGSQLHGCEDNLHRLLSRHTLLKSFQAYLTISRASLRGETLQEQALETEYLYRNLGILLTPLQPKRWNLKTTQVQHKAFQKERHENLA